MIVMKLSQRAQDLTPSATLAMAARAAKMRSAGIDVISFATGEPDFDTPSFIKDSAKKALDGGKTKYTPTAGIPELKKAIRTKFKNDNDLDYSEDEIVVTCGAKQAIYNALQAVVDPGDEVIIPAPYWVSYPEQVRLAGGTPVILSTTSAAGFKLNTKMIENVITKNTKAIILNSPSNPSGSAYKRDELKDIAELLVKKNIAIISDEIYEKLVYDGFKHTSIVSAYPAARALTFIINGVAKSHAMTGWRMGYAAGPKDAIAKLSAITGQQTTCIPPFVQLACVDALLGPQDEVEKMRLEFSKRRDIMLEMFLSMPGIKCHRPEGTFYLLPNIEAYFKGNIKNATDLANYLLDSAHIATISGEPFGAPGHIRFSYATSRENIEAGMKRLKEALLKL